MKSADVSRMFPEGGGVLREASFPDFEIVIRRREENRQG
jgi:hypothetical protein